MCLKELINVLLSFSKIIKGYTSAKKFNKINPKLKLSYDDKTCSKISDGVISASNNSRNESMFFEFASCILVTSLVCISNPIYSV